jgi:dipeptidyl aminopeptidase/acylaminoacyl peptidase
MKLLALLIALLLLAMAPTVAEAAGKRPMKLEDLYRFQRVSDPQISPDGSQVAYVVGVLDMEANKIGSAIWLAATDGKSSPRQLTNAPGKKDRHPRWSPDGKRILFESNRGGDYQLWILELNGGEAKQLTTISTEANNAVWSRDGKQIAFVSAVYPEFSDKPFKESDELNKKKMKEIEDSPVKARVFTRLFFRHWDSWVEDKRQHLFVLSYADGKAGEPKDATPGERDAYPTSDTFSTGENFTFSSDGKYLVFTAVPARDEAWSTNYEICRVPVAGGKFESLTAENKAASSGPVFSPDGKHLAYRAQKRPGFEADRWELMAVSCDEGGAFKDKPKSLTPDFDRSVDDFVWQRNDSLCFSAEESATKPLWVTTLKDSGSALQPKILNLIPPAWGGTFGSLSAANDGRLAFTVAALSSPPEVFTIQAKNQAGLEFINLSRANGKGMLEVNDLDLPRPESVRVKVEGGEMQMWILKPPGFDEKKKWPLAYLVHGGPQGAWEDGWSYRWCPELWAAQGYVVALPNPRGSTGFGQKFVDEISGDWGGKCYDDLMKGVDYLEKLPYIDKDRMGAAGASFGGYMMNWFAVNTGRFKCLITHCSVWNFESMFATTDELWFDEWEHGGLPWDKPEAYAKFSPHKKAANLGKFKTPMLIIHNDNDFRCPIGQGLELFTCLQRQRVPSRFLNFPDESHWVLKPKNGERWHKEVFAWLTKYVPPGGR